MLAQVQFKPICLRLSRPNEKNFKPYLKQCNFIIQGTKDRVRSKCTGYSGVHSYVFYFFYNGDLVYIFEWLFKRFQSVRYESQTPQLSWLALPTPFVHISHYTRSQEGRKCKSSYCASHLNSCGVACIRKLHCNVDSRKERRPLGRSGHMLSQHLKISEANTTSLNRPRIESTDGPLLKNQ